MAGEMYFFVFYGVLTHQIHAKMFMAQFGYEDLYAFFSERGLEYHNVGTSNEIVVGKRLYWEKQQPLCGLKHKDDELLLTTYDNKEIKLEESKKEIREKLIRCGLPQDPQFYFFSMLTSL